MNKLLLLFIYFLFFLSDHLFKVLQNIDLQTLEFINHNRIKSLDGFFIFISSAATVITYSIPVILLLYSYIKHTFLLQRKSWLILICLVINSMIIHTIKNVVNRQRPFVGHPMIQQLVKVSTASFPSAHTAEVFLLATAITLLFPNKKLVIIAAWIWALLISYSRMALGVHYPSDVLASMIISSSIAIILGRFLIKRNFLIA